MNASRVKRRCNESLQMANSALNESKLSSFLSSSVASPKQHLIRLESVKESRNNVNKTKNIHRELNVKQTENIILASNKHKNEAELLFEHHNRLGAEHSLCDTKLFHSDKSVMKTHLKRAHLHIHYPHQRHLLLQFLFVLLFTVTVISAGKMRYFHFQFHLNFNFYSFKCFFY